MKTSQEQIIKALSGLIPEEAQKEVGVQVGSFLENAIAELEEEYNQKLEEAYRQIHSEKVQDEKVAEEGYTQAWDIITDLRDRLEVQREEFEQALEEGYEEAYQMLQEERAKNDTLEVDLYEEFDKRLGDIKEYLIDKIDQFLAVQGDKYYEMARRDVMNDPAIAEHKVAFEKILEVASNYLTDEDAVFATSTRLESLQKSMDEQKAQMRILEAKNMRLATDNSKLNEAIRHHQEVITEHVGKSDKKARAEKARKVEGRGQLSDRQVVIGEYNTGETAATQSDDQDKRLVESIGEQIFQDWRHLSGLTKKPE